MGTKQIDAPASEGLRRDGLKSTPNTPNQQGEARQNDARPSLNTPVKQSQDEAPQNQSGAGDRGGGNKGKRLKHDDETSPEALTAKYTFWLFGATIGLVAVTFVLAIGTILLAVFTFGLYRQTRSLAEEAVKQGIRTDDQIAISEGAAATAVKAAEAAIGSLEEERAWICFDRPDQNYSLKTWRNNIDIGPSFNIRLVWKNAGRSPALECAAFTHSAFSTEEMAPVFQEDEVLGATMVVTAPNGTLVTSSISLAGNDYTRFQNTNDNLWIKSRVVYKTTRERNVLRISQVIGRINKENFEDHPQLGRVYTISLSPQGDGSITT